MVNCNLKKILYIPLALLVAVAVVMNVVPASVYAVEIESLPVDNEDLKISYDSDGVRIEDNGNVYEIPFEQDVRIDNGSGGLVHLLKHINPIDVWVGNSTIYVSTHTNSDVDGNAVPFSYWYSPSEKRVYTFTGHKDFYKIDSYSNGVFHFYDIPDSGHFLVFGYFDLINGIYKPMTVLGGSEGTYKLESGYTLSSYNDYEDIDGFSHAVNIPSDLICVYSSYEISGFYEPDDISVFTPDYYFDYQYIYYKEDYGYVFIDSARPVKYIESIAGGTYANIVFDEACNKHIYTSTDGVNWSLESSVVDMYGIQYQLPHNWLYDLVGGSVAAVLIYTNDEGYAEEPLVTPEFGDIEDITENLNNIILDGAPLPSNRLDNLGFDELNSMSQWEYQEFIMYGLTHEYYWKYTIIYDDGGEEDIFVGFSGRTESKFDGSGYISSRVKVPTLAAYLYDVNMTLDDFVALYQLYSEAMHMDMKAIFDNITNTNTYLYDVKGLIQDLPDYSSKLTNLVNVLNNSNGSLNEINEKLDNIANLMSGSGESSPDDGSGSSSTLDVLNNIDFNLDKLSDYFVADNGSAALLFLNDSEQSNTNAYDTFQDFLVTIDDEILTVLYDIADDVDDDDIIDDLFDVENEEDENYWSEVSAFVNEALSIFTTNSVLSMAYTYAGSVSDGIGWLNARVDTFYNSSDIYKPVITLGAILFLVSVYLRKGGY